MKISDQNKMVMWSCVKSFRKYMLRPYNKDEKKRDLKNLRLHKKDLESGNCNIIFTIHCVKAIEKRLQNYEDYAGCQKS